MRPFPPATTTIRMQTLLLEETYASHTVITQLNMCKFRVRTFIANGDCSADATGSCTNELQPLGRPSGDGP